MTHIDYGNRAGAIAPADEEWLSTGAEIRSYLNTLATRSDLIVAVGPDAAFGDPACFIPSKAEIRIDTSIALPGVKPGTVDLKDSLWRLEHATFMGAAGHEAAHAAHTRWKVQEFLDVGATPKHLDVISLLEEPRCEHQLIQRVRGQKPFLRSTALELILQDFKIPETPYGAAAISALVLGRVDGGSLEEIDGEALRATVLNVLPASTLDELEDLWKEFNTVGDRDLPSMFKISKQWLKILQEDPDNSDDLVFPGAQSKPSDSENSEEGAWIRAAVGGSAVRAEGAIIEKRAGERNKRAKAAGEADHQRRQKAEKAAVAIFHGSSDGAITAHRIGERPATEEEHRAATELAQALMVAENHEKPDVERAPRHKPPGRLRTRAAAQAAAYAAIGVKERPDLFRARTAVPDARGALTVATMLDISGSMVKAAVPLASTQWVIATAGSRIGARTASVHFGAEVHGVDRLGTIHEQVQLYACTDPWENFEDAFLAIDHEITLLDGAGTRLLVIASDANYRKDHHAKFAEAAMTMCKDHDVNVLWLKFTQTFVTTYGHGSVLDVRGLEPEEVARKVGKVAVEQLAASR